MGGSHYWPVGSQTKVVGREYSIGVWDVGERRWLAIIASWIRGRHYSVRKFQCNVWSRKNVSLGLGESHWRQTRTWQKTWMSQGGWGGGSARVFSSCLDKVKLWNLNIA